MVLACNERLLWKAVNRSPQNGFECAIHGHVGMQDVKDNLWSEAEIFENLAHSDRISIVHHRREATEKITVLASSLNQEDPERFIPIFYSDTDDSKRNVTT